jgi:hypothetical protein
MFRCDRASTRTPQCASKTHRALQGLGELGPDLDAHAGSLLTAHEGAEERGSSPLLSTHRLLALRTRWIATAAAVFTLPDSPLSRQIALADRRVRANDPIHRSGTMRGPRRSYLARESARDGAEDQHVGHARPSRPTADAHPARRPRRGCICPSVSTGHWRASRCRVQACVDLRHHVLAFPPRRSSLSWRTDADVEWRSANESLPVPRYDTTPSPR